MNYRKLSLAARFANLRETAVATVYAVLRIDQWPERIGPWIELARDVLAFAARRTRDVRLAQVAGSLTFTTVLSIVPLLAVALAVFTAFPLFAEYREALEKLLLRELLPPQISVTILRYLNDFTAKATGLTAYGLLFLVVAALLMIFTVDRALNDIWNVRQRRGLIARILVYWALLTLAPLAIGASVSATSYVLSTAGTTPDGWQGALRAALDVLSFVLGGLALSTLYVIVPNRRVLWRDALIGGFSASLIGEFISQGFAVYIKAGTVAGIYGAFSALPLFLLWVYLSWFALLFGAAIAATLPMLRATRFADERRAGNRFLTAMALLRMLLLARLSGEDDGRRALDALARAVRTFPDQAERLLVDLEKLGYVSRLNGTHAGKWLLTCDADRVTLKAAFSLFAIDPANTLLAAQRPLRAWLEHGTSAEWLQLPLRRALADPAAATVEG